MRTYAIALALTAAAACSATTPAPRAQPPEPTSTPAAAPDCEGRSDASTWTQASVRALAPLGPELMPDALAMTHEASPPSSPTAPIEWLDPVALHASLFGSTPTPNRPGIRAGVCLATEAPTAEPALVTSGRIHRIIGLRGASPDQGAFALVLHTAVAPADLMLDEREAEWSVSLVDEHHRVVATTSFTTELATDRTYDVLQTELWFDGTDVQVEIRYGLDCDGHKHDQHFHASVALGAHPTCLRVSDLRPGSIP